MPIKFRAWNKKTKIMSKVGPFMVLEPRALIAKIKNGGHRIDIDDIILEQFTGTDSALIGGSCQSAAGMTAKKDDAVLRFEFLNLFRNRDCG